MTGPTLGAARFPAWGHGEQPAAPFSVLELARADRSKTEETRARRRLVTNQLFACRAGASHCRRASKLTRHSLLAEAFGCRTLPKDIETKAVVFTVVRSCGERNADGSHEHPGWQMLSGHLRGCLQS